MSLKIHNFLISHPILLKLFLIGLSDFSGSIESNLFWEWTWALTGGNFTRLVLLGLVQDKRLNQYLSLLSSTPFFKYHCQGLPFLWLINIYSDPFLSATEMQSKSVSKSCVFLASILRFHIFCCRYFRFSARVVATLIISAFWSGPSTYWQLPLLFRSTVTYSTMDTY